MMFVTEEQYAKFQASKYMGLLYENKMTCNVESDYYDVGVHYLEIGQGTDDSLKDEIFQFFMDNAAPAVVNSHNFNYRRKENAND